ncbi:MAG: hypothetical protein J0H66_03360 [Solirubrobacterales bacterium]|nr:hypothetical protein [Solirubrobacterales bacterium]
MACSPTALQSAFSAADSTGTHVLNLAAGCEYGIGNTLSLGQSGADVTVNGNGATIDGGGATRVFDVDGSVTLTLNDLMVTGGSASYGAGVNMYGSGNLNVNRSTFEGNVASNFGGAIYLQSGGIVSVTNSTFAGNVGSQGGALYAASATYNLTNVTATGNSSTSAFGGAIFSSNSNLTIRNTIFAGNLPNGDPNQDCYISGGTNSGSNNLTASNISGSGCVSTGFALVSQANLALGGLADNGGLTPTVPIGAASVARAGATSNCPATDQRDFLRPSATNCDVGAYQFGSAITVKDTSAVEGDSGTTTLSFPVTLAPAVADGVTIDYEVDHVTTDDSDFVPEDGQLVLDPGETSGAIEVDVSGDTTIEPDETFTVTLTGVTTAAGDVAIGRAVATGTVINDDQPDHQHPACTGGVGDAAALAAAVTWANGNGQDDEIFLGPGCVYDTGSVGMLTVGPDDGHSLTITGDDSTIDASHVHVVLAAQEDAEFNLDGVTVANGVNPGTTNGVDGLDGYGGGLVINGADVTVSGSSFVGNSTTYGFNSGYSGGAIFAFEGDDRGASLDVSDSSFTDNESGWGGAIDVQASDYEVNATVSDSTFTDNEAENYGGAIDVYISSYWGGSGLVSVTGSTFTGNHAGLDGGALDVTEGDLKVVNSTVQGNSSGQGGAALRVNSGDDDSAATVINSTLLGNRTGGNNFYGVSGGSHVTLKNSILAGAAYTPGGTSRRSCPNSNSGMHVTASLSDDSRCALTPGFTVPGSLADLHLGGLADNGGRTRTVALLSGSPAIDAGDQSVCDAELPQEGGSLIDQRGWHRGQNPPNPCDIGAYEADRMRIGDAAGTEGTDTQLTFPVTLDAPAPTDVSVHFATRDGTAVAGTDYVATSGDLTIDQGQTSGQITVDLIDNEAYLSQRQFYVDLTAASGAAAVVATGTGTITDDDVPELTVSTTGAGSGTVTSDDGFIDCGGAATDCTHTYSNGEQVTLTATPGPNSVLAGWSGGGCSGTGACVVDMSESRNVTADFAPVQRQLTVSTAGTGTGEVTSSPAGIECGAGGTDCSAGFSHGTEVTLTASPVTGSDFTGWSGACSGTGSCVVTMDQARAVTATFDLQTRGLTVDLAGNGSGGVASTPAGIDCGGAATPCDHDFDYGASVTLDATPAAGSDFTGWSGACSGTGSCVVTMDQARAVTATFILQSRDLKVNVTGAGRVTSSPAGIDCDGEPAGCTGSFDYGTEITLTAVPGPNSTFTGWSGGGCSGAGDCVVELDQTTEVTADFAPVTFHTLNVQVQGEGKVTGPGIECGQEATDCSQSYEDGTVVSLDAAAATGWGLAGYTVPCSVREGICELTMDQDRTVTATFSRIEPSNQFRIGNLDRKVRKGIGFLPVTAPGPGKVLLAGPKLKEMKRTITAGGKLRVKVRLKGKRNLKQLRRRGKIRPKLRVTYTPSGGSPRTKKRQVTLILKR